MVENIILTPDAQDLAIIQRELNKLEDISEAALAAMAGDLASGYKKEAFAAGAINTKAFVNGIDARAVSARQFVIGSDVDYEIWINEPHGTHEGYHLDEKAVRAFLESDAPEQRYNQKLFEFLHQ